MAKELRPNHNNQIIWKLTPNGEYTTASAYAAQFNSCTTSPKLDSIWKAEWLANQPYRNDMAT
jgi:hypothetical protein